MLSVRYLLRRLLETVPVLVLVTLIVFGLLHLIPGDPAVVMLGPKATPERVDSLRVQLGLDAPLPVQYGRFVARLLRLDLGTSLRYRVPVAQLIAAPLGVTLSLILLATLLAVVSAVPLALVAALRRDSPSDQGIRVLSLVGLTTPPFGLALLLLLLFGIQLRLFPVGGFGQGLAGQLHSLVLPALTLSCGLSAVLVRSLRSSVIDVLSSDYVRVARAKGLRARQVVLGHVLRSGLLPTVTLLGINLSWLIGGTVVVEKVFALPGIGALMVDAIFARDYPVVQAVTLVFALLVVGINVVTDLSYALLDPRVTLA